MVVTRVSAKDAIEALMAILALKGPSDQVAAATTFVLNGRLIRKLCEKCKQPYQPTPQMLQKLGIPAGRVQHLYREFQPPPPAQRVDEKGRPIEIEICEDCGGLGYRGRTSILEMLEVNDAIRAAIGPKVSADALRKAAKAAGHRSLHEEGVLLVAQGITSLNELQRVLKQ
jgi:type II secretory ATPase GspE/PulE/Tfp pilus assembly ATPase PilB-like protein